MSKLTEELNNEIMVQAKKLGYTGMFYTPDNINSHIEKYSQDVDIQGLTLLYGTINYLSIVMAKMVIKLEDLNIDVDKLLDD